LAVTGVRPGSPAARQGLLRGDVLVGMHVWQTVTLENVEYILKSPAAESEPLKFYILRTSDNGSEVLWGRLDLAGQRMPRHQ